MLPLIRMRIRLQSAVKQLETPKWIGFKQSHSTSTQAPWIDIRLLDKTIHHPVLFSKATSLHDATKATSVQNTQMSVPFSSIGPNIDKKNASEIQKENMESITKMLNEALTKDTIGVCATHISPEWQARPIFSFQADKDFPMASIYKLPIAIYCLHLVELGQLDLNQEYLITEEDCRPEWAKRDPNTFLKAGTKVKLEKLIMDMMEFSGNTATDALLKLVGGTAKVTHYLRDELGISNINLTRTIKEAFANLKAIDDGVSDRATPEAINLLLSKLFSGKVLKDASHVNLLFKMMQTCKTAGKITSDIIASCEPTEIGHKSGSVPGLLRHCVTIMELKEGRGTFIISTFIQHKLDKKMDRGLTDAEKDKRMELSDNLIAEITKRIYQIGIPSTTAKSRLCRGIYDPKQISKFI